MGCVSDCVHSLHYHPFNCSVCGWRPSPTDATAVAALFISPSPPSTVRDAHERARTRARPSSAMFGSGARPLRAVRLISLCSSWGEVLPPLRATRSLRASQTSLSIALSICAVHFVPWLCVFVRFVGRVVSRILVLGIGVFVFFRNPRLNRG